jgi:hypothetical protein
MSTPKRSVIWKFFGVGEPASKAICKTCKEAISRGTKEKDFSTKPLWNHLLKHPLQKKQAEDFTKQLKDIRERVCNPSSSSPSLKSSSQVSQPNILACFGNAVESQEKMKHQKMDDAIAKMIAWDLQPFSMVEDKGFQHLMKVAAPKYKLPSRKFFSKTAIPKLYDTCRAGLEKEIALQKSLSFTTDTWTCQFTTTSYICLSAHWLTEDFTRKSALLAFQALYDSHTGENLAGALTNILKEWKVEADTCHILIRDNAANIAKGSSLAGIPSRGCFLHSLQLALNDGLMSQPALSNALKAARGVVGHFKHSSTATARLHCIQEQLGIPTHQLVQVS